MRCNHCLTSFHPEKESVTLGQDGHGYWSVDTFLCPACDTFNIYLVSSKTVAGTAFQTSNQCVYPKAGSRPSPPKEVPAEFANDYKEACLVISDSPKASAALSRRCLQHLLRKYGGVKPGNLNNEIDEVLAKNVLPSHLAESIDAVRITGNFAAHPIKSTTTGDIVEVEPGEAEWNLDVIESLFDFYIVQPALTKAKRAALDKKLLDAAKPPLKK